MSDDYGSEVYAAFEMLLEEIEEEIATTNQAGARAFAGSNYDRVQEAADRARGMAEFREKVTALRKEWAAAFGSPAAVVQPGAPAGAVKGPRQNLGRAPRRTRTPEEAYCRPILQALTEMNGAGRVRDVLARVEQMMKPHFTPVDLEPLRSTPQTPRWYNAAQWARDAMVKEGLLKPHSPHGTWEISDAGRRALQDGKG